MHAMQHLYIHVPFCRGKCAYCAFYSVPYDGALADRFLDGVAREMTLRFEDGAAACQTIYIGGGTPSLLPEAQWERLLQVLSPVAGTGVEEWTVEANPGTLTPTMLERMAGAGVNRVSMGVQSLDDDVLGAMRRPHAARDVAPTVAMVRAAGIRNVGLDLIAGLPGVEEDGWRETLAEAVALEPDHLSVYALGVEAGTDLARRVQVGDVGVPGDAVMLRLLDDAAHVLHGAGYGRYEISNYARPGRECRHNLSCWRGGDYIGLGPAASSRAGLERWTTVSDVAVYCKALSRGHLPPVERETVDARTDLIERLIFGLRLSEGAPVESRCKAAGRVGEALWAAWLPELVRLGNEGLLVLERQNWKATRRGLTVLDAVLERLVD